MQYIVITPFFPSNESFRGPFVLDQVKAIQKNSDFDIVVLKPKPWYSKAQDYEYEGIRVHHFSTYELPSNMLPGLFEKLSMRSFFKKLKSLRVEFADIKVIHAHVTGQGVFANALKKKNPLIKTLLQHHGFDVLSTENGILRNIKLHQKWVERYGTGICNKIDCHIGVSQKTLSFLKQNTDIEIKNSYVLYNGVDATKFYPLESRDSERPFTIGCIGNFWTLKDQMTLLRAADRLRKQAINDFKVKLIGTGPELEKCKDFVNSHDLGNHMVFISEIPHDELIHFYNSLDLFVLPSYYEAFGCVYTEAYACGVPFMAVVDQGIAELIPEEVREEWLIEKGDDKKLSLLIERYKVDRPKLKLNKDIDINNLVISFLRYIDTKL